MAKTSPDDVHLLHQRLRKAVQDASTAPTVLLELLQALDKTSMTLALLKDTKLGLTVGKLRKHEHGDVAECARRLVKQWKSIAMSPEDSQSHSSSHASHSKQPKSVERKVSAASTESSTTAASPASSSSSNGLRKAPRQPSSRVASAVLVPEGLDKMRGTVRTKLFETLAMPEADNNKDNSNSNSRASDVALAIEIVMAQHFHLGLGNENKKDYLAKFRQLSFNLKKNAPLREDVVQDIVSAEQLITMSPEELATDEKRSEMAKLRDDAFQRARLDWADANEDKINKQCGIKDSKGLFTCGRCKSTKTSNTQKQTRSADEPMTVFVHCHNCGNRWKC